MIADFNPTNFLGQVPADNANNTIVMLDTKSGITILFFSEETLPAIQIYKRVSSINEMVFGYLKTFPLSKKKVVINSPFFSVFPPDHLNLINKDELANSLFKTEDFEVEISNHLPAFHFLFLVDKDLKRKKTLNLPFASFYHAAQLFLLQSIELKSEAPQIVNLDIQEGFFYASMFQDGELKLINSYSFSDINEFGFYSLGIIKNLDFDSKSLILNLSGNVADDSPMYSLLKKYITNIRFHHDYSDKIFYGFHHLIRQINS